MTATIPRHYIRDALAPLLAPDAAATPDKNPHARRSQQQWQQQQQSVPCLVSQYFQTHDALAVLRALGEAADGVLARQLRGVGVGGGKEEGKKGGEDAMDMVVDARSAVSLASAPLAPVALLLALHVLHRLVLRLENLSV